MLVAGLDTVVNFSQKSKVSNKSQKATIAEDNVPFKELEEEIENLRLIQLDLFSESTDKASFSDVDAEVLAVQPPPSDAEIGVELLQTEDVNNYNEKAFEMNLCIAPTETSSCKLSSPWKNSPCFQKMVQLFLLMRIILLALLTNGDQIIKKHQLEIFLELVKFCKYVQTNGCILY